VELDELDAALGEGVENGVLSDDADVGGLQLRALRNWLHLLGYLARDNEKTTADGDFTDAMMRFRAEAGLNVPNGSPDGAKRKAVELLRRLVCFDADVAVEERFEGVPLQGAALARAVSLRLYALDFLTRPPDREPDREAMLEGLGSFARVQELLGLERPQAEITPATLRALFSTERVLERLRTPGAVPRALEAAERLRERKLVKNYVDAVASIELWLVGYLARPRRHMEALDDSNRSLPAALRAFWRDQPEEVRPPKASFDEVGAHFFARLDLITRQEPDEVDDDAEMRASVERDSTLANEVKRETQGLGARILDGIRRVARFIGGWLRRRLGGLIALARNIAGVLARGARAAFTVVRDIATAMKTSWSFLVEQPVSGSDAAHVVVSHDRDFDFVLAVHDGGSQERIGAICQRVLRLASLFATTARFVGQLIGAFLAVAKRAGLGGWFGAILALLEIRRRVQETIELVRALQQQVEALTHA
jgi:hypothetical protein